MLLSLCFRVISHTPVPGSPTPKGHQTITGAGHHVPLILRVSSIVELVDKYPVMTPEYLITHGRQSVSRFLLLVFLW